VTAPAAREVATATNSNRGSGTRGKAEVVCFRCSQKGHKAPDCPTRPKTNRRIQCPDRKPLELQEEEFFGAIGECKMSITVDTGAQISVVPRECVHPDRLMGVTKKVRSFQGLLVEGEACSVDFVVGDRVFSREAVAVEGSLINWTPCLQVPFLPREDLDYIMGLAEQKNREEPQLYQPPRVQDGVLHSGFLVSRVTEEGGSESSCETDSSESIEQVMSDLARIEIEEVDGEVRSNRDGSLMDEDYGDHSSVDEGIRVGTSSDLEEAGGVASGGCAGMDVVLEGMDDELPRKALAEATVKDDSLQLAKQLATDERQGYRFENGVIMRDRLNDRGECVHQVCVPDVYRGKCLSLVHTKFGHQGRNKMISLLKPYFYWPKMARDCVRHIKGCTVCQTFDKANPPRGKMQMREIASTPFERVAGSSKGSWKRSLAGVDSRPHW